MEVRVREVDKGQVWMKVLRAALSLPGCRINREDFLYKELSKRCPAALVKVSVETSPILAGVSMRVIEDASKGCIKWYSLQALGIAFAAGLPGGWWAAATVPADLAAFYYQVLQLTQKLAYLYGWPDLFSEQGEPDDETLYHISMFIALMAGSKEAAQVLKELARRLSEQVVKRLPQKPLTKYALYNMAKQIVKWLGGRLTKEGLARFVGRVIPVVGGVFSGEISRRLMISMGNRLRRHLAALAEPLSQVAVAKQQ